MFSGASPSFVSSTGSCLCTSVLLLLSSRVRTNRPRATPSRSSAHAQTFLFVKYLLHSLRDPSCYLGQREKCFFLPDFILSPSFCYAKNLILASTLLCPAAGMNVSPPRVCYIRKRFGFPASHRWPGASSSSLPLLSLTLSSLSFVQLFLSLSRTSSSMSSSAAYSAFRHEIFGKMWERH